MARVVLAENDLDLRTQMAQTLERAGHGVETLDDGPAALRYLAWGDRVDLLVMDLDLPGRSNLEVITRWKRVRPRIAVIVTSGKERPVSVALELARRSGADAVLAKPFRLSTLTTLVARVSVGGRPRTMAFVESLADGDVVGMLPPIPTAPRVSGVYRADGGSV